VSVEGGALCGAPLLVVDVRFYCLAGKEWILAHHVKRKGYVDVVFAVM